jgi:hypothetical protein
LSRPIDLVVEGEIWMGKRKRHLGGIREKLKKRCAVPDVVAGLFIDTDK